MRDAEVKGVKKRSVEMKALEKEKSGCENPSKYSPMKPKAKDLKVIPRDKVRGHEKVIPKASKPKEKLTREEALATWKPKGARPSCETASRDEKPRLSQFEVGECSGVKDEIGRYIEESEVEETEEFEMMSEHEMLRRMKRKPKGREKSYRGTVCSGRRVKKSLEKK